MDGSYCLEKKTTKQIQVGKSHVHQRFRVQVDFSCARNTTADLLATFNDTTSRIRETAATFALVYSISVIKFNIMIRNGNI